MLLNKIEKENWKNVLYKFLFWKKNRFSMYENRIIKEICKIVASAFLLKINIGYHLVALTHMVR